MMFLLPRPQLFRAAAAAATKKPAIIMGPPIRRRTMTTGTDKEEEELRKKIKAKLDEPYLNVIQKLGPIEAAHKANEDGDTNLMFHSIKVFGKENGSLLPPDIAEPVTLRAFRSDKEANREFTREPEMMTTWVTFDTPNGPHEAAMAVLEVPVYASLITAIYVGLEWVTLDLMKNHRNSVDAQAKKFGLEPTTYIRQGSEARTGWPGL